MPIPTNSSNAPPVFWHIVINHKSGKFLNRMLISMLDASLANEIHLRNKDGIQIYLEKDAIKFFPSTHPLGLDPPT